VRADVVVVLDAVVVVVLVVVVGVLGVVVVGVFVVVVVLVVVVGGGGVAGGGADEVTTPLATVTFTAAVTGLLPDHGYATTERTCGPFERVVVSSWFPSPLKMYGS
jgi:hypothetical protein